MIAAGQFGQLRLALTSVPQLGHSHLGDTIHHLLANPEVVVGSGRHQGLVGDAEHLPATGQLPQQRRHGGAHPTADAGIDFVKQQRLVGIGRGQAGFQGQQKATHLATGGHLRQRGQGLTWIGREHESHRIRPLLGRGGGLNRHGKAPIGQAHRPQGCQQLLLQGGGCLPPRMTEPGIDLVPGGDRHRLPLLQCRQVSPIGGSSQLLAQPIPQGNQGRQIETVAPLQGLELGHPLLQKAQAVGIAIQGCPVAIQLAAQALELNQGLAGATAQGGQGAIQLFQ